MNDPLVYIARALDKSWAEVFPTQEAAQAGIAAREPDLVKQSGYQILVEPLSKLLANRVPGIERTMQSTLVKWDGEGPIPDDAATNPEKYPQISEVLRGGDRGPVEVLYRR